MIDKNKGFRKESDTMGSVLVPEDAYYSAQTQRAKENFQISTLRFSNSFIRSLAIIKKQAAKVNSKLGRLDNTKADAIINAAQEVVDGKFEDQFVVDIFQTGSGTSTNMNMNEVLSTRANELLTGEKNAKTPIHPNDHVNLGQSSNDVIPTTIHITSAILLKDQLLPSLKVLLEALQEKSKEFKNINKVGRTHMQDAVPMTLGEEFSGYARQVELGIERIEGVFERLTELALGGTAVGNGLNTDPRFAAEVIDLISNDTGLPFKEAKNHFAAQGSQDTAVELSGILKSVAGSMLKIACDIRLLSSGPKCGLGELNLPELQPGSSIMPGKVNPVIPEVVVQGAAQVVGNDATITMGGQWGILELNVMLPVIAYNLIQSIELISSIAVTFAEKCIRGITVNREKCRSYILQSQALATYLIPTIGYDMAATIAKKSSKTGKSVPDIVREDKVVSEEIAEKLFSNL